MPTFSPPRPGTRPERAPAAPAAIPRRPSPTLLTIPDVARRLIASIWHVRRLIARGELPVHRFGRLVRVSEDDLARLVAASRES